MIIPGNRYGIFLVTTDKRRGPHNELLYKAICECGQECWMGEYLLSPLTPSACPHIPVPLTPKQALDKAMGRTGACPEKVGDKIGFLLAEDRLYEGRFGPRWLCQCDCGAKIVVSQAQFRGKVTSCGCMGIKLGDLAASDPDLQALSFIRPRGKTPSFSKSMEDTKIICKSLSTGEVKVMQPLNFKHDTSPLPERKSRIIIEEKG